MRIRFFAPKESPLAYVIIRSYSRYHDHDTNTGFDPVLDVKTQRWVGAANVSADFAKKFEGRGAFEVLSNEDYLALITPPDEEIVNPFVMVKEDAEIDENHMEDTAAVTDEDVAKHQDETSDAPTVRLKSVKRSSAPPEPPK